MEGTLCVFMEELYHEQDSIYNRTPCHQSQSLTLLWCCNWIWIWWRQFLLIFHGTNKPCISKDVNEDSINHWNSTYQDQEIHGMKFYFSNSINLEEWWSFMGFNGMWGSIVSWYFIKYITFQECNSGCKEFFCCFVTQFFQGMSFNGEFISIICFLRALENLFYSF